MIFVEPGQPFVPRAFDLPELAAGELLVEVTCTTLCGSDLHTYTGRRAAPCPTILGHEILGRVARLPAEGSVLDDRNSALNVGYRVTWSVAASCGQCFYCGDQLPQKCERLFKYGHQPIDDRHPLSGGLATHCHLAAGTAIVRVPDALSDEVAAPANCATATVAAALRTAGPLKNTTLLVQGAGMLGLTACAMAREAGAREMIVCDVEPERLQLAQRFGATRTLCLDHSTGSNELVQLAADLTSGRGVDVALELSGAPAAVPLGVDALRIGGRYVWVGAVFPSEPIPLLAETIVRRLLRIEGVHNYAPGDLRTAIDFLAAHHDRYPFAELVSARFPLDAADDAFQFALRARAPRVAVVPSLSDLETAGRARG